jgi:hypothetical protein
MEMLPIETTFLKDMLSLRNSLTTGVLHNEKVNMKTKPLLHYGRNDHY